MERRQKSSDVERLIRQSIDRAKSEKPRHDEEFREDSQSNLSEEVNVPSLGTDRPRKAASSPGIGENAVPWSPSDNSAAADGGSTTRAKRKQQDSTPLIISYVAVAVLGLAAVIGVIAFATGGSEEATQKTRTRVVRRTSGGSGEGAMSADLREGIKRRQAYNARANQDSLDQSVDNPAGREPGDNPFVEVTEFEAKAASEPHDGLTGNDNPEGRVADPTASQKEAAADPPPAGNPFQAVDEESPPETDSDVRAAPVKDEFALRAEMNDVLSQMSSSRRQRDLIDKQRRDARYKKGRYPRQKEKYEQMEFEAEEKLKELDKALVEFEARERDLAAELEALSRSRK